MPAQILTIPGVINARGVGEARMPWLYRSATLDAIDPDGVDQLLRLGIGLVIDLRDDVERTEIGHSIPVARVPIYGDTPAGPPKIGSLLAVYRRILDLHGDRIVEAVGLIARAQTPVLVHCTAGKDRTGLVVAIALAAAGIPDESIVADYVRSEAEVRPARIEAVQRSLSALGLDDDGYQEALDLHVASPGSAIRDALAHLHASHGDAGSYLRRNGLSPTDLASLRAHLGGRQ